ncbi:hypothetical protein ACOME3_007685 [Neoechinorhynchus agilis]
MPVSCGNAGRKTAPSESSLDNSLLHLFNNKLTEDDKRRILSLCPDFCKVLVQLNGWFNDSALKRSKNENLGCMIEHVNQHLEPLLNFLRTQKIPMAEEMKKRKVVEVETILKRHRAVDMSDFLFDTLAVKGLNWRRTFSVKDELLSKEKRKPRLEELSSVLLTKIEDISKSLTKHETGLTERMEEAMRLFEIELEFFKKAVEDSRVLKKTESMMQTPKVESVPLKRVECHSVTNNQLEPIKNIKRRREVKRILWKRLDTGRLMQMKIRANELRNEIENALKQLSFLKPMYNGCLKLAETRKQCARRTRNANRKLRLLNEKEKKFKTEIEAYSKAVEKANIRSERKSSAIAALESKLGAKMNKLREWSKATKMYEEQIEMMKVNTDRTFYEALTFERRFNEITRVNETEVENHEEIESALQWTQRYIRRGSLDIAKISSQIENVKRKYTKCLDDMAVFVTSSDAEDALENLTKANLHGRELLIEFAQGDRKTPYDMRRRNGPRLRHSSDEGDDRRFSRRSPYRKTYRRRIFHGDPIHDIDHPEDLDRVVHDIVHRSDMGHVSKVVIENGTFVAEVVQYDLFASKGLVLRELRQTVAIPNTSRKKRKFDREKVNGVLLMVKKVKDEKST